MLDKLHILGATYGLNFFKARPMANSDLQNDPSPYSRRVHTEVDPGFRTSL